MSTPLLWLDTSKLVADPLAEVRRFELEEALSQDFRLVVDLVSPVTRGFPTPVPSVDLTLQVGLPASVSMTLVDGGLRYIHGIVAVARQGVVGDELHYHVELEPFTAKLRHSVDCKIFHQLAVPEILTQLLLAHGLLDFQLMLTGVYPPRSYCVQYRESAHAFMSRLLEDEGIFYYFTHTADRHVLVFADAVSAYARVLPTTLMVRTSASALTEEPAITDVALERVQVTRGYLTTDYNFITPLTPLTTSSAATVGVYERFEYPGGYQLLAEGERRARVRVEQQSNAATKLYARSFSRNVSAGAVLSVLGHPGPGVDGEYVTVRAHHLATVESYENRLEAIPAALVARPEQVTPKPRIHGVQTATVVVPLPTAGAALGAALGAAYTEVHAQLKVRFHWDRLAANSCWIRVAQSLAGPDAGAMLMPTPGQEVVVSFVDGDPDRPLIVGCVYNEAQPPPIPALASQTKKLLYDSALGPLGPRHQLWFDSDPLLPRTHLSAGGDNEVRIVGNDSVTVGGKRRLEVVGDFELVVGGKLSIVAIGGVELATAGSLGLAATGAINLAAGEPPPLASWTAAAPATPLETPTETEPGVSGPGPTTTSPPPAAPPAVAPAPGLLPGISLKAPGPVDLHSDLALTLEAAPPLLPALASAAGASAGADAAEQAPVDEASAGAPVEPGDAGADAATDASEPPPLPPMPLGGMLSLLATGNANLFGMTAVSMTSAVAVAIAAQSYSCTAGGTATITSGGTTTIASAGLVTVAGSYVAIIPPPFP